MMAPVPIKKQGCILYEIMPSAANTNQGIETLLHAMHVMADHDAPFGKESFSLELHADKDRISYHFATPEKHAAIIQQRLQHGFKGSGVRHASVDIAPCFSKSHHAVALRLKQPAFLPISTDTKARMFDTLVSVLEHLEEGEQVMVQILLQPVGDSWKDEFKKQYESWLDGADIASSFGIKEMLATLVKGFLEAFDRLTHSLLRLDVQKERPRHAVPNVRHKLSQQGFRTGIRVAIDATPLRQRQLASSITGSFRTLARENDFVQKKIWLKDWSMRQMEKRRMPLITFSSQILSSGEVANLIKLPDEKVETAKLNRMAPQEMLIADELTHDGMLIGSSTNSAKEPIHLSTAHPDDTSRIKVFIASPGAGKSTIIEQLIYEGAKKGHGAAVFDIADGDLAYRIPAMLPEYKHKIHVIDFADEENPPAINFSALGGDEDTRGLLFGEFFEQLFETADLARTQSYLLKAALSVFSQDDSTLLEFILMLRDEGFRQNFIPKIRKANPDLYLWWMQEFPKVSEQRMRDIIAPILVRLDSFLYNTKMKNILCQKGGQMNPAKWMADGDIVVFNLPNGTFTEPEQRMIMSLLNAMFWNATLAREKLPKENRRPFHIFYDEPQTYINATPMASRAISKARKYRVSLNFFIQEAEQLIKEDSALWKEMIGMSPHLFVGPVSEYTAKQLKRELAMDEKEILSIKKHKYNWIVRTFHNKEALPPFVFQAAEPRDGKNRKEVTDTSHVEEIKRVSRERFSAMPKSFLKEDISARNMGKTVNEYRMLLASYSDGEGEVQW